MLFHAFYCKSSFFGLPLTWYPQLQVLNCHDSVIYILAPLRFATVYGCSDATIVLGAVGKVKTLLLSMINYYRYTAVLCIDLDVPY